MNAKEKAKELVDRYMRYVYCYMGSGMLTNDYDEIVALSNAKQCALICVDEILNNWEEEAYPHFHFGKILQYWKEVKNEINLL